MRAIAKASAKLPPFLVMAAVLSGSTTIAGGFMQDPGAAGFLLSAAKVTEKQLASVRSGQPLVLSIDTKEKRELAVVGAVQIAVPADFFVKQYRQIEDFKRSPEVLQVGKFSEIPVAADLQTLTFDPDELAALLKCRSEHCPVKMSAQLLQQFRAEGGAAASFEGGAAAMRRMLASYVADYLKRGNEALVIYDDHRPPVSLSYEFQQLLEGFSALALYAPEFVDYLKRFPAAKLSGVENFVYWSREKAGFKTVTSLTHVSIYRKDIQGRNWSFITSKDIYSNHYFEGSLGVTVLSSDTKRNDCWMVYMNRSRTDVLRGWFSGFKKSIIRGRVEGTMKKQLEATKKRLERNYKELVF